MSIDVEKLPPPCSGKQEVQFRRFLSRCFTRVKTSAADAWKRDAVFHQYVEDLQDQLAQLRNNTSVHLPNEVVTQYVLHVDHLSNALLTPDVPLYCKELPRISPEPVSPTQRPALLQASGSEAKPDVYRNFGKLVRGSQVGDETKKTLEMHAKLQENMTDELLKLARDLKQGTRAMQCALEKRDAAIEAATDALEFSATAAQEASKNAAKQYKTSRMGTCRMLLMLLFVGFVFTAMMFFIRITSFIGYRSYRDKQEL